MDLIPNQYARPVPTTFSIRFIEGGLLVDYSFSLRLGTFLDADFKRKVIDERLSINEAPVFIRTEHLNINTPSVTTKKYLNPSVAENLNAAIEIAESGLDDEELFLCNGYKTTFSDEQNTR